MKSNDEEYLDSLLSSARNSNTSNPMSALSRMSGKGTASGPVGSSGSGDIGALVNNSNGNEDLNDIGSILDRLDRDELVDDSLSDLLDSISRPTDSRIPKFTVGGAPSAMDVRDPEEIALDEAIADAERLDAEIRSGKFDNIPIPGGEGQSDLPEQHAPIVDLEDGDDALLEMAPEVSLPEGNDSQTYRDLNSDANETPEQILTDLLDDMPDDSLMQSDEGSVEDSLRDVLDNMKEEGEDLINSASGTEPAAGDALEEAYEKETSSGEVADKASANLSDLDDIDLDNISLEDLDYSFDGDLSLGKGGGEEPAISESGIPSEAAGSDAGEATSGEAGSAEDMPLDDLEATLDGFDLGALGLDDLSMDGVIGDAKDSGDEPGTDGAADAGADSDAAMGADLDIDMGADLGALLEPEVEMPPEGAQEETAATSDASVGASGEDEFNLGDLEASLDDLISVDENNDNSTEGEVAEVAAAEEAPAQDTGEGEEMSMQDLDALMNSLANDEIEDIESTIDKDIESGHADESEIPKEDILGALTENGFDDLGDPEPSLDELASIPERPRGGGGGSSAGGSGDDGDDGDGKKKKKKGFFARLLAALVKEDEEPEKELASLTAENQQVLDELGEDGGGKGKKKKQKKEKKAKEKKPKKEKPPKEKKPKKEKPKKEKKPKPPKDPGAPEKAISPKKIALSGIFAASLGILVLIPSLVLPDRIASQSANAAYNHREYTTAYKLLYGKKLDEDQSLMYEQSRVLAWAQRYLDGYENYSAMNMKEEALDMLLMAMRNQDALINEAQKYSVEIEVNTVYDSIISVLSQNYGLSEADIVEINSIKKDRDYTIRLMEIVGTLES